MQYLSPFDGFRKTLILLRREQELRHALKNNLAPAKVQKAAERVRTAKLHLLKAFRHSLVHGSEEGARPEARLRKIEKESDYWSRRSVDSIVDEYKREKSK